MARLFNAYVIVDWSAASKPNTGADSVWIGVLKRDELPDVKDKVAIELMRSIKALLDPLGIMNPGKVL